MLFFIYLFICFFVGFFFGGGWFIEEMYGKNRSNIYFDGFHLQDGS